MGGILTHRHHRGPLLRVLLHYFPFHNQGQVKIAHATTFFLSRRQTVQGIHGFSHRMIAFSGQVSKCIPGVNPVALALPCSRIHRGEAGPKFCLRALPRKGPSPAEIPQRIVRQVVVISPGIR